MSRERAEAYLRLLAEEELRRPAWPRRVRWAAVLLIAMSALDDVVAGQIVADFDLAVLARQAFPTPVGRAARLQRGSAGMRFWPAMPVSSLPPGAGPVLGRVVRLGRVLPVTLAGLLRQLCAKAGIRSTLGQVGERSRRDN
jgi:hypothetical protein